MRWEGRDLIDLNQAGGRSLSMHYPPPGPGAQPQSARRRLAQPRRNQRTPRDCDAESFSALSSTTVQRAFLVKRM